MAQHLLLGVFAVMVVVGAIMTAASLEAGSSEESFDANMSKAFKTLDVNIAAKLSEINLDDPDLNQIVHSYVKSIAEGAKGGVSVGIYLGKRYPGIFSFWAIPITILVILFLFGFPTFTLIGCGILIVYDRAKGKKWSEAKPRQVFLR